MLSKLIIISAVVCVVIADRSYRPPQPQPQYSAPQPTYQSPQQSYQQSDEASYESPKYNFDWVVDEQYTNFQQQEEREDDNTKGSYSVDLPDGRRQIVTYYVDGDSGFVAEVSYEGEASYPESREYSAPAQSAPRPQYSAPQPTPRPTYQAPTTRRTYTQRPTTRRSYTPPKPTTPRPQYEAPKPQPQQTYQAPRQAPRQTYATPQQSYSAPNSAPSSDLLSAYGFGR